jgi:hypothetical protein
MRISSEVRAAMKEIALKFGRQGGKTAARNMTAAERSARAKEAAGGAAAAQVRTAERLARERAGKRTKRAKRA